MGSKLKTLKIPSGVIDIGDHCFSCCSSLIDVYIPKKIDIIREGMLHCCYSLQQIVAEGFLSIIEKDAFNRCSSLQRIVVPSRFIECYNKKFPVYKDLFVTF